MIFYLRRVYNELRSENVSFGKMVNRLLDISFPRILSLQRVFVGPSEVRALPLAAGINLSGHYF